MMAVSVFSDCSYEFQTCESITTLDFQRLSCWHLLPSSVADQHPEFLTEPFDSSCNSCPFEFVTDSSTTPATRAFAQAQVRPKVFSAL